MRTGSVVGSSVLKVDDVSVTYYGGAVRACKNVSFNLLAGECLGVIGPNGAGKSSLISAICGDHPARSTAATGSVSIDDEAARGGSHARARMGLGRTYQVAHVFPELQVRDQLEFGAMAGRRRRGDWLRRFDPQAAAADVEEIVTTLGLTALLDASIGSLSEADRKRVELASVMAGRPKVLLLDEPTAGMGRKEAAAVCDAIEALETSHPELAIILVEHNMDVMFRLSDRVLVMHQGQVLMEGPPESVRTDERVKTAYLGHGR